MASFLSLSTELKLNIIEQLNLTSTSFIPAPHRDLLGLSRVCKALRTLTLPYLFKNVTLLNDEKSSSSVLAVLNSSYAKHVKSVHYIGIMAMSPEPSTLDDEPPPKLSSEDLPTPAEQVLSNLAELPNLEQVIIEFRCGKTSEEDEESYRGSYDIYEELENYDEQVLEAEKGDAFRSLMKRSYDALARNTSSTIPNLELRNVVAKACSSWETREFQAILGGLSSFTISLRGGDNGAGWQINMVPAYLAFIESLDKTFFEFFDNLKHLHFAATMDGPPGLEAGMNNVKLPLNKHQMTELRSLELQHVFISQNLAEFIINHGHSLETVRLDECYSGLDENNCAEEVAISWGDFFSMIASSEMKLLRTFEVGPSDLERTPLPEKGHYKYNSAVLAKELREDLPGRRMLDYKQVDDKYGMLFDSDLDFDKFEDGTDHAGWEQLCALLRRNAGDEF